MILLTNTVNHHLFYRQPVTKMQTAAKNMSFNC